MNLFVTAANVMAMAAATFAEHLASSHGVPYQRRSLRSSVLEIGNLDAVARERLIAVAHSSAADLKFDVAVLDAGRSWSDFKVLASDMDSTLISIECIDEIADFCGKKDQVAAITEAAMRGEISDFSDSLRRRVAILTGTPVSVLARVFDERLRLSPGAVELLASARSHQLKTLLVSGGFTYFTERLKTQLGLDQTRSNQLGINADRLSGTVEGNILDGPGKRLALIEFCQQQGASAAQAIAIGDGANDLPMMNEAGLSVAYHAKAAVRAAADVSIRYGGLDVLAEWLAGAPTAFISHTSGH